MHARTCIGTKTADTSCVFSTASTEFTAAAVVNSASYDCACVPPAPAAGFSWQAAKPCSPGQGIASPYNICKVKDPQSSAVVMGWLDSSTCHFPPRNWGASAGSGRAAVQSTRGFGGTYNMQQLCFNSAGEAGPGSWGGGCLASASASSIIPAASASSVPAASAASVPPASAPSVPTASAPSVPTASAPSVPAASASSVIPAASAPSVPAASASSVPAASASFHALSSAASPSPVNGGTEGQVLCRVAYSGEYLYGTKTAAPNCAYSTAATEFVAAAVVNAAAYDCGCAPTMAAGFSWQAAKPCSPGLAIASPNICRIKDSTSNALVMGWLSSAGTCYFPPRNWGTGGAALQSVRGWGGTYNMQQLCFNSAGPVTLQQLLNACLPYIQSVEGMKTVQADGKTVCPYWDENGLVWTVGYGSTLKRDGSPFKGKTDCISMADAVALLPYTIEHRYWPPLTKIPGWQDMNVNQQCALLSISYNYGPGFYGSKDFPLCTGVLSNKDWKNVPTQCFDIYKSNGAPLLGLLKRRLQETKLWAMPASGSVPCCGATLPVDTCRTTINSRCNCDRWPDASDLSLAGCRAYGNTWCPPYTSCLAAFGSGSSASGSGGGGGGSAVVPQKSPPPPPPPSCTLGSVLAKRSPCVTSVALGLTKQIAAEMKAMGVPAMSELAGHTANVKCKEGGCFDMLQASALDSLIAITTKAKRVIELQSAFRSTAQQYLLYKWKELGICNQKYGVNLPGTSYHESGLAIDVDNPGAWVTDLKNGGWQYPYPVEDNVHFEWRAGGLNQAAVLEIAKTNLKAFQRLWNRNNPNDQIKVDGVYGDDSMARLNKAPCDGW
ncbi:hypothetical protein HXX76_003595 [Chlamydomonas incerta]|uniref:D-alanyl-D-alanine carboxypeptidase-like core domain-containing protein n=1 Tax=Chlamydomonas incerta TaxID=51695 RepID=A0A835T8P2_CHLIN|nr:hypothetical protein HXX76_003595 [Chlamydomonas incerta]|eukprot:KAG2440738.1 hypothetical protein HXX76_003595 [Chlamydomonas incerta]